MLPSRRIWVSPPILHPFAIKKRKNQGKRIPQLRQLELSFWRWSAIPRHRRRLRQNLTKSSMEDFPNIAISHPFPTSRHSLKKFIGMLRFASSIHCLPLNCVSRWKPVFPLGRSSFFSNKLTSLSFQGVAHQSTGDDLYKDYHIPSNSVMIPNQW